MRLGGVALATLLFPALAYAALININTADAALLDTLPGIGPTKANAIVDYRTLNGPFARIEDIQNVTGIGPATYADIASLITVGSASSSSSASTTSVTPSVASSSPPSSSGALPEYLTRPPIRIVGVSDRIVSVGADTAFTATVYDGKGTLRPEAEVVWVFGDGARKTGRSVYHAYYAPGEYVVIVRAKVSEGETAEVEVVVTATETRLAIQGVSEKGIELVNNDSRVVDLSGWRLASGDREFRIPEDTYILDKRTLLFSSRVTGLSAGEHIRLLYPDGTLAHEFSPQAPRFLPAEPTVAQAPELHAFVPTPAEEPVAQALAAVAAADGPTGEGGMSSKHTLLAGLLSLVLLAGGAFIFL